jgi:hydroxyethylthiazole kinase-like uncharacterized protein yjeF
MTKIMTSAQMSAVERAAIESGEVTGLELMEQAGQGVVDAIYEHWSDIELVNYRTGGSNSGLTLKNSRWAVILCGPGNNGGDGYVVARLLRGMGWAVSVLALGDPQKLPPDALSNYKRWQEIGSVSDLSRETFKDISNPSDGDGPDLYIDALFGTGIKRPITGVARQVLADLARQPETGAAARIVSIDAPSGLCLDSGRLLGHDGGYGTDTARFAGLTVAFDSPKLGHFLADGPALCGRLVVKDIGLGNWRHRILDREAVMLLDRPRDARASVANPAAVALPEKSNHQNSRRQAHKFSYGHALVLSGGSGQTGAARLAARGALRIGAGLVTLAVPPEAMTEVAQQVTAVMVRKIRDADDLSDLLHDRRLTALCLGPGLGLTDHCAALVRAALQAKRATVLDADALTLLARDAGLRDLLHESCVLTPHAGEFSRLFPSLYERWVNSHPYNADPGLAGVSNDSQTPEKMTGPAFSKVDAVREAAQQVGCTILLKGQDTVIAVPSGEIGIHASVYERAAPWLATAGSGDVLAGFITGLLAMGRSEFGAAATGAWMHAEAARSFGPGLVAEDLPEQVPRVLQNLSRI